MKQLDQGHINYSTGIHGYSSMFPVAGDVAQSHNLPSTHEALGSILSPKRHNVLEPSLHGSYEC